MKPYRQWAAVLGIAAVMLAGCRTTKPAPKPVPPAGKPVIASQSSVSNAPSDSEDGEDEPEIASRGSPESLARFAAGLSYSLSGDAKAALEQFRLSAIADPTNEVLLTQVARGLISIDQATNAVALLELSARRSDASAAIFAWLARAQAKSGLTNQAVASAKRAIDKQPGVFDGYEMLFALRFNARQYPEALDILRRASRGVTNDPEALLSLAGLCADFAKTRPAEEKAARLLGVGAVDRAVAAGPLSEQMTWAASVAYEQLDEPVKAAAVLKQPEKEGASPALRERLANLSLQSGDKKHAAEELQALVRDYPARFPQAWFMLGTLADDNRDFDAAIRSFQKAILLEPGMESAYYNLALAELDAKKNADALDTLENARRLFPNTFLGEYFTGIAFGRLNDWSNSVRHLTSAEVIAKTSNSNLLDAAFYFHFGSASERNRQYDQAADCFQKCLALRPGMHEAMNYLGYMWAERGENLPRARDLIDKAVKAEPTNAAYLDSMGWVLFKQNKAADALGWLIKARDFSPEPDSTLFEHLGDVYAALGNRKEARAAFEKSLSLEASDAVRKKLEGLAPP